MVMVPVCLKCVKKSSAAAARALRLELFPKPVLCPKPQPPPVECKLCGSNLRRNVSLASHLRKCPQGPRLIKRRKLN